MLKANLRYFNLETTITDSDDAEEKVFTYKLPMKYKDILSFANVNFVNIANNHILDFKEQGFIDTTNSLDSLNIKYTGCGYSFEEASRPIIYNINGCKILIFSAADHYKHWDSKKISPGIWYINLKNKTMTKEAEKIIKEYIELETPDITIFSIHWGPNYSRKIDKELSNFAKVLANVGIDIIHSHSAHHILPYEQICLRNGRCCPVFYSLGDFIDDYYHGDNLDLRAELSIGVTIQYKNNKFIQEFHYFDHSNYRIKEANDEQKRWIINKLNLKPELTLQVDVTKKKEIIYDKDIWLVAFVI